MIGCIHLAQMSVLFDCICAVVVVPFSFFLYFVSKRPPFAKCPHAGDPSVSISLFHVVGYLLCLDAISRCVYSCQVVRVSPSRSFSRSLSCFRLVFKFPRDLIFAIISPFLVRSLGAFYLSPPYLFLCTVGSLRFVARIIFFYHFPEFIIIGSCTVLR